MGRESELFQAARLGNVATIDRLLSQGHRGSGKSGSGKSGISIATVRQGLLKRPLNPNCQDDTGNTPLHHSALNGHREAVSALLRRNASTHIPDARGNFPLHLAAWNGHKSVCDVLLHEGQSRANVDEVNSSEETAVVLAAQHGHVGVVKLLIECGSNTSICNVRFESALDLAAQYGHHEVVKLLCRNTRLLKVSHPEVSAFHLAAKNGHVSIVRLLVQCHVDINVMTSQGTGLHEAALFGRVDVVKLLLDSGIDASLKNESGLTAYDLVNRHHSSQANSEIRFLLDTDVQRQEIAVACQAHRPSAEDTELLAFEEGDRIQVLQEDSCELWTGMCRGKRGQFPASLVKLEENEFQANLSTSPRISALSLEIRPSNRMSRVSLASSLTPSSSSGVRRARSSDLLSPGVDGQIVLEVPPAPPLTNERINSMRVGDKPGSKSPVKPKRKKFNIDGSKIPVSRVQSVPIDAALSARSASKVESTAQGDRGNSAAAAAEAADQRLPPAQRENSKPPNTDTQPAVDRALAAPSKSGEHVTRHPQANGGGGQEEKEATLYEVARKGIRPRVSAPHILYRHTDGEASGQSSGEPGREGYDRNSAAYATPEGFALPGNGSANGALPHRQAGKMRGESDTRATAVPKMTSSMSMSQLETRKAGPGSGQVQRIPVAESLYAAVILPTPGSNLSPRIVTEVTRRTSSTPMAIPGRAENEAGDQYALAAAPTLHFLATSPGRQRVSVSPAGSSPKRGDVSGKLPVASPPPIPPLPKSLPPSANPSRPNSSALPATAAAFSPPNSASSTVRTPKTSASSTVESVYCEATGPGFNNQLPWPHAAAATTADGDGATSRLSAATLTPENGDEVLDRGAGTASPIPQPPLSPYGLAVVESSGASRPKLSLGEVHRPRFVSATSPGYDVVENQSDVSILTDSMSRARQTKGASSSSYDYVDTIEEEGADRRIRAFVPRSRPPSSLHAEPADASTSSVQLAESSRRTPPATDHGESNSTGPGSEGLRTDTDSPEGSGSGDHFSEVQAFAEAQLAAMLNDLEVLKTSKSRPPSTCQAELSELESSATDLRVSALNHSTPVASPVHPANATPVPGVDLFLADLSGLSLGGTLSRLPSLQTEKSVAAGNEDDDAWSEIMALCEEAETENSVELVAASPRHQARIRQANNVSQWLDQYHLSNYASLLIQNGYDHLHYMNGNIMTDEDLLGVGIVSDEDRSDLLACASMLSSRPLLPEATGVQDWLNQLQLLQHYPDLLESPAMRPKEIVCLWTEEEWKVAGVTKLGHRRRLVAHSNDINPFAANMYQGSLKHGQLQTSQSHSVLSAIAADQQAAPASRAPARRKHSLPTSALHGTRPGSGRLSPRPSPSSLAGSEDQHASGQGPSNSNGCLESSSTAQDRRPPDLPPKPKSSGVLAGAAADSTEQASLNAQLADSPKPRTENLQSKTDRGPLPPFVPPKPAKEPLMKSEMPVSAMVRSSPVIKRKAAKPKPVKKDSSDAVGSKRKTESDRSSSKAKKVTHSDEDRGSGRSGSTKQRGIPTPSTSLESEAALRSLGIDGARLDTVHGTWQRKQGELSGDGIDYDIKYLGSMLVKQFEGSKTTEMACNRMRQSTAQLFKIPQIILRICNSAVVFLDSVTKRVIQQHEMRLVLYVSQDPVELSVFGYVSQDMLTDMRYCHVFRCYDSTMADEILLTFGQVFHIAYKSLKEQRRPSCVDCGHRESRCECDRRTETCTHGGGSVSSAGDSPRGAKRIPPPKPERKLMERWKGASQSSITSQDSSIVAFSPPSSRPLHDSSDSASLNSSQNDLLWHAMQDQFG